MNSTLIEYVRSIAVEGIDNKTISLLVDSFFNNHRNVEGKKVNLINNI